jgi:hypothetical protein
LSGGYSKMKAMSRPTGKQLQQGGFAALIISFVLVTVLGLITVGFAQLARRELNNELNRRLSNGAFYAAESGVNDAVQAIAAGFNTDKTKCDTTGIDTSPTSPGQHLKNANVDELTASQNPDDHGTPRYTCLLIDQAPPTLEFSGIGDTDDTAKTFRVIGCATTDVSCTTPANVNTIKFAWQNDAGNHSFPASNVGEFPSAASWTGATGVLRIEVAPLGNPNAITRDNLINGAFTAYLYPKSGGGAATVAYATGNNSGQVVRASCMPNGTPRDCQVTLTGLNAAEYLVRINSIYDLSTVTVSATGGGSPLRLSKAQALIDSTGEDEGVLRRIQVRVPNSAQYDYPQFVIEAGNGICKLYSGAPTLPDGTNNSSTNGCDP